ncbi:NYN domain-containing protein [Pontibacter silvestris]|uniref:NYN domain-containing protein n=1 Tax=Pontibacter silvestris TaxID=2305183 RepID=A0ABW4WZQ2_9BACT|nr:NYN domain-containing protein [Pontibacter silvestris]MCC9138444.1 NYN domain-containing protein [Pontibacter silvestris]
MKNTYREKKPSRMSLLIDGDNAQPSLIVKLMAEAGKYGSITIRRIYGDWTTPQMNGWKECLNNHAIQPIQQFRYTVGKNATDSALIIDAMDLLHSEVVDGFCIVSSDSDYTRLATRIRESGVFVMGIGQRKTPKPFVNACNVFIYTENLTDDIDDKLIAETDKPEADENGQDNQRLNPVPMLKEAFSMAADEDGWAHLGSMGMSLRQLDPSFDPRTFGYGQLSQLIEAHKNLFIIRKENDKGPSAVYVKQQVKPHSKRRSNGRANKVKDKEKRPKRQPKSKVE